jgi:hypothetical protein
MRLNIIHIPQRTDRMKLLQQELYFQGVQDYRLWDGIVDPLLPYRGISKAHKQIVRHAKENSLPEVLIAEDDLHFTSKNAFQFYLENKPSDYDIYLGGIYSGNLDKERTVKDFSGLTLYSVHQRFYDSFLSISEDQDLDRALCNKGKFSVCYPFVVTQHSGFSDNVKKYCDYDKLLLGRALFKEDK